MAYATVTLTGTYQTPDGTPHRGHVEIIPSERVIKDTTGDVILTGRVKVELDAQGAFTVVLPATDDPTLNPTGFGYTIAAKLHSSHPPAVSFSLPASLGATTVEDLTPVDPSTFAPTTTYAESSEVAALDVRVTSLEDTPPVTSYNDLTDKPTIPSTAADVNALPDTTVIPDDTNVAAWVNDPQSQTRNALSATYARIFAPEAFGAVGDGVADDTTALQAAVDAAVRQANGEVRLRGHYKISAAIDIDGPVTIRGINRAYTKVTQATAAANGFNLHKDTQDAFTRGVSIENVTIVGAGRGGVSTGKGINGTGHNGSYQGQALLLRNVNLTDWDTCIELEDWDNCRYEQIGLEYSRIGLYIHGNANTHYVNASGTNCTETCIRIGDGMAVILDLRDIISCGMMVDMGLSSHAVMLSYNLESCTGSTFVNVQNGARLVAHSGRILKNIGGDVPGFTVDFGGTLTLLGMITYAGFTNAKAIRKANNNATVFALGPTRNLSAVAETLIDDVGNMAYTASPWPTRQENAVPGADNRVRNMLLGAMTRDTSNAADKLFYYGKDRTAGTDAYQRYRLNTTLEGTGSPEGVVAAPIGTMYLNLSGGVGTTLYVKETGTGNTGWAAK